jgi:hypothetical protein
MAKREAAPTADATRRCHRDGIPGQWQTSYCWLGNRGDRIDAMVKLEGNIPVTGLALLGVA